MVAILLAHSLLFSEFHHEYSYKVYSKKACNDMAVFQIAISLFRYKSEINHPYFSKHQTLLVGHHRRSTNLREKVDETLEVMLFTPSTNSTGSYGL